MHGPFAQRKRASNPILCDSAEIGEDAGMTKRFKPLTNWRGRSHAPADKEQILSRYEASRLSQREFARQQGLGLSTLQLWLRQRRQAGRHGPSSSGTSGPLVEVALPAVSSLPWLSSARARGPLYEIELGEKARLRLSPGFCLRETRALLTLLREL